MRHNFSVCNTFVLCFYVSRPSRLFVACLTTLVVNGYTVRSESRCALRLLQSPVRGYGRVQLECDGTR